MRENTLKSELHSCEKEICDRKEGYLKRYGLNKILMHNNTREMRYIVLPLSRLAMPGFLLLYLTLAVKRRLIKTNVYKEKIALDDHGTKIIASKVFSIAEPDLKEEIINQELILPLMELLKIKVLTDVVRSYYRNRPRGPNTKASLCEFWIYYIAHKYLLPKKNISGVLVVDDFSANRVALILAAKEKGLRTGLVRLSDELKRPSPFFSYDVLFCWHDGQALEEHGKYRVVAHLERKVKEIKLLANSDKTNYTVGIALKSNFNEAGVLRLLKALNNMSWVRKIIVRYHPITTRSAYIRHNKNYPYQMSDEKAEEFFDKVDLLFSGSTSLVKAALLSGVPVAYNADIDASGGQDFYGYRKEGVIIDLTGQTIDRETLNKIDRFYSSEEWKKLRDNWVKIHPDALLPAEALKHL